MGSTIHPQAVVDRSAELGDGVVVKAQAVVGADVVIGDDCEIGEAAHVVGPTRLGKGNVLYPKATVGFDPQDLKWEGETVRLEVGDGNTFREFCTIHRGHGVGWRHDHHR